MQSEKQTAKGHFVFRMEARLNTNFSEMVKRLSLTLKRIAYGLNRRPAFFNNEDLYQEALLRLWQDFQEGRLSDKTDSYILQGCYFHLKNYLRKAKINNVAVSMEAVINEEGLSLEEVLSPESAVSCQDQLEAKMLSEYVQNNGFTSQEKEVFSLSLEGLTTREIGRRLGVSHVRIVKVKGGLKKKLTAYLGASLRDCRKNPKISSNL